MFNVTLVNLSNDARSATKGAGPRNLGQLSANELLDLLADFAQLDPVQNIEAEPEIRVQSRRERYAIRTGEKKLYVQDERNLTQPTQVLSPEQIIAELDGTAAAQRRAARAPIAIPDDAFKGEPLPEVAIPIAPRPEPSRKRLYVLVGIVVLLAATSGYLAFAGRTATAEPGLQPLTKAEQLAEDSALTGVYVTTTPRQEGIVISGSGRLKLFRVNVQAAPGVVYGTYELGRRNGKICLATDQPGGVITVRDRESLEYGGTIYKRVP